MICLDCGSITWIERCTGNIEYIYTLNSRGLTDIVSTDIEDVDEIIESYCQNCESEHIQTMDFTAVSVSRRIAILHANSNRNRLIILLQTLREFPALLPHYNMSDDEINERLEEALESD